MPSLELRRISSVADRFGRKLLRSFWGLDASSHRSHDTSMVASRLVAIMRPSVKWMQSRIGSDAPPSAGHGRFLGLRIGLATSSSKKRERN
jgi:hypothetical protein